MVLNKIPSFKNKHQSLIKPNNCRMMNKREVKLNLMLIPKNTKIYGFRNLLKICAISEIELKLV